MEPLPTTPQLEVGGVAQQYNKLIVWQCSLFHIQCSTKRNERKEKKKRGWETPFCIALTEHEDLISKHRTHLNPHAMVCIGNSGASAVTSGWEADARGPQCQNRYGQHKHLTSRLGHGARCCHWKSNIKKIIAGSYRATQLVILLSYWLPPEIPFLGP